MMNKVLDAWLNIDVDESKIFNPLSTIPSELEDEPHLYITWLMQQPEYFSFACEQIFNVKLLPTQALILQELWRRKFPMYIATRGFGKSFLLALYALLRLTLLPGRRIVICGAAFRQSKIIFDYMDVIWKNAPLLRDMVGVNNNGPRRDVDMCRFHINDSLAVALPIGDGTKIRGQRANDIIADEFASISREIFETVIAGFGVVRASPIDNVIDMAAKKKAQELGIEYISENDKSFVKDNQIIISGTADYDFKHFGEYWRRWHKIISSKGEDRALRELFGDNPVPEDFNWRDYSIIRIPFELVPKGFMDESMVARSKATIHTGIYLMEYGACFAKDSYGFFKRSLIESCVVSPSNDINLPSGRVLFHAMLSGNPAKKYVFGIDPASEIDKFAITIVELNDDHRRIVHVWTTTRSEFKEKLKAGLIRETDFYGYCARKIRDLMKKFPCERIALDTQGGGVAVLEALHDMDKLMAGELPIWPIINPDKPMDTDGEAGLHIIELISFASADWTSEANHGLRKDFEDKVCLFPYFDAASLELAAISDQQGNRLYDSLEDCLMEIEELKNELSMIIMSVTPAGRERWDTPEIKLLGNKKGHLRKDRYTALLMANAVARKILRSPVIELELSAGGFASSIPQEGGRLYVGPSWLADRMKDLY